MKSVGEVMAIGRTFKEALQKGIRGLEIKRPGSAGVGGRARRSALRGDAGAAERRAALLSSPRRSHAGWTRRRGLHELTHIDPWFLANMKEIVEFEPTITAEHRSWRPSRWASATARSPSGSARSEDGCPPARAQGRASARLQAGGHLRRRVRGLHAVLLLDLRRRGRGAALATRKKIMILGGGPNRIGQGIEFDYCCVHAAFALREIGYETIMVNSNPETVSTDYDTSDKLYFEPLDPGGRPCHRGPGEARRRASCSSAARRRSNLARGPGEGGRAHHRHQPGLHRQGGGPQAVLRAGAASSGSASRRTAPR